MAGAFLADCNWIFNFCFKLIFLQTHHDDQSIPMDVKILLKILRLISIDFNDLKCRFQNFIISNLAHFWLSFLSTCNLISLMTGPVNFLVKQTIPLTGFVKQTFMTFIFKKRVFDSGQYQWLFLLFFHSCPSKNDIDIQFRPSWTIIIFSVKRVWF